MNPIDDLLRTKHSSFEKYYGNNYWESCVYEGILKSTGILDRFSEGILV